MTAPNFSDEELMAYADGQLDETRASEIDAALATDQALADRLALFVESRAGVAAAYAPMLEEPVPDELMQSIRQMAQDSDAISKDNTVVAFQRRFPIWQTAIAASIALAIGFGSGLFMGKTGVSDGLQIGILDNPEILAALSNLPSGEQRILQNGDKIVVIETFRDGGNNICREFEYQKPGAQKLVAISCYDNNDSIWAVKMALAAPTAGTDYAPASALPALDAYLDSIKATPPLALEEEQKALADLLVSENP